MLAAADPESPGGDEALERLCQAYWYPLYAHVRRRGTDRQEAQDLAQAFFPRLLEKSFLRAVDRNEGRFRTFLLTALDHFPAKEWRHAQAQKPGGGQALISLDGESVEDRYRHEPRHDETPERLFERQWALSGLMDDHFAIPRSQVFGGGHDRGLAATHIQRSNSLQCGSRRSVSRWRVVQMWMTGMWRWRQCSSKEAAPATTVSASG